MSSSTLNPDPPVHAPRVPITPRQTRLFRALHLPAFRECLVDLACAGAPLEARDRLIVVPTRAAAALLVDAIESRANPGGGAAVLPDFITARELVQAVCARLPLDRRMLTDAEREVLLGQACRDASDAGATPPFHVRPPLVAEMLRFYDALGRHQKDLETFERLALGRLEPGAEIDRGAERLVRQTRFLVDAFRRFEASCRSAGADEHELRAHALGHMAAHPVRHIVVSVGDRAFDRHGLDAADWDLLARLPGLERLDVVVTDAVLAGAPHERLHALLPGIEEVRTGDAAATPRPTLLTGAGSGAADVARDREEEVAGFARRVKHGVRSGRLALEDAALVANAPLPYVYLAREVFRSSGLPSQMFDALPLAAEPYAAAFDLVCEAVLSSFARAPSVALLRSPHFDFTTDAGRPLETRDESGRSTSRQGWLGCSLADVAALDRLLVEAGYLGEIDALERVRDSWRAAPAAPPVTAALRALDVLAEVAHTLSALRVRAAPAAHLDVLIACLVTYGRPAAPDDHTADRQQRARGTILGLLRALRNAYARFDTAPLDFETLVAVVRRWIEHHTFAPRTGDAGVHVVDAESARFGRFELVQLAGLVDGEWPDRPRRNVFYGADILRDLGWPSETGRRDAARARFAELLGLPRSHLIVSTFALESDAPVSPSVLLEDLDAAFAAGRRETEQVPDARIFEYEALALDPVVLDPLEPMAAPWVQVRQQHPGARDRRYRGHTAPHPAAAWSLTALERYQDCPFRFFASHVLRLQDEPEDASTLTARARGRFVHDVLHRFIQAWDARGSGPIVVSRLEEAREVFVEVAEPLLARLPEPDAALERARLFGSAASMGAMEVLLGIEASRPEPVEGRWLEHRFGGRSVLGGSGGAPVELRGVADRVDLLPGRRLRVIDYKTGAPPDPKRALQAAAYALLAREALEDRDSAPWSIHEAAYVTFGGTRPFVPVVKPGAANSADVLEGVRSRIQHVLAGIGRGTFPPRPYERSMCRSCAFPAVCREDYDGDG